MTSTHLASTDALARLRYLDEAADLMIASSPSTSSFLGAQKFSLTHGQPSAGLDSGTKISCNACGTILIPGWSCCKVSTATQERNKGQQSRRRSPTTTNSSKPATIRYQCQRCGSRTEEIRFYRSTRTKKASYNGTAWSSLPIAAPSTISVSASTIVPAATAWAEEDTGTLASAANKKRSRTRKPAGLQAMLAKNKSEPTKSAGLNLMDFMKSMQPPEVLKQL